MTSLGLSLLSGVVASSGLSLPAEAIGALLRHAEEMVRWNSSIRLTAITKPEEIAVKHVLDSLLLLRFAPFPGRTLDFGSGAGYPGIPLAVACPDARVVLLDASAKKCAFLSHACAMIGLKNAEVVRGRIERGRTLPIGLFGQIVTRAAVAPPEAAALLVPYLSPGGRLLLMTGKGESDGRRGAGRSGKDTGGAMPPGFSLRRREPFTLPFGMGTREILEISPG